MVKQNSLSVPQRLKSTKQIDALFENGKTIYTKHLKIRYAILSLKETTDNEPIKIMVSVPKRIFKLAVKRNLLKRRIRESYRINKHVLEQRCKEKTLSMHLAFIFNMNEIEESGEIEKSMIKGLDKLCTQINVWINPTTT